MLSLILTTKASAAYLGRWVQKSVELYAPFHENANVSESS